MPGTNLTREEAQQRATLLTVDSYEIDLDLSGAQEGGTYRSVTTVRFDVAEAGAETFIDLVAPAVHEVILNGDALDVAEVFRGLPDRAARTCWQGRNELRVVADCAYTNTGEGLHRFVDPVDEQAYLYTQFEVPDARRVFASFEQPDLKATFQFTVKAPEGWTVISNSPTPEPKDNVWVFEPTPAHLDVHHGADRRPVPLGAQRRTRRTARPSRSASTAGPRSPSTSTRTRSSRSPGRASTGSRRSSTTTYPFAKYDQLFVPEFNAGAMENAGAVTIRDQYVFRSKVTDAAYEVRAETILHELAHMWFGDLVTMEWWNDLWLNESFATYTSIACQAYAPGSQWPHSWTTFANSMKTWAYRQDQLPSTHPIMAEIRDLDDVLVNFDGITYAKGASVLKQLVAYVGKDEFFAGVQAYFKAHAFGNTRLSDLLGALEETSGRDLTDLVEGVAGDGRHQRPAPGDRDGRGRCHHLLRGPPGGAGAARRRQGRADAAPAPHRGRPVRARRTAASWCATDRIELDVDGELTAVPQLVGTRPPGGRPAQRRRPVVREGPPGRGVARHRHRAPRRLRRSRCRARCAGPRPGT